MFRNKNITSKPNKNIFLSLYKEEGRNPGIMYINYNCKNIIECSDLFELVQNHSEILPLNSNFSPSDCDILLYNSTISKFDSGIIFYSCTFIYYISSNTNPKGDFTNPESTFTHLKSTIKEYKGEINIRTMLFLA